MAQSGKRKGNALQPCGLGQLLGCNQVATIQKPWGDSQPKGRHANREIRIAVKVIRVYEAWLGLRRGAVMGSSTRRGRGLRGRAIDFLSGGKKEASKFLVMGGLLSTAQSTILEERPYFEKPEGG